MAKVRRGVKGKLLEATGFAKGWIERVIMLCRDGNCSNDIVSEVYYAYNHIVKVIKLIESSEVVR